MSVTASLIQKQDSFIEVTLSGMVRGSHVAYEELHEQIFEASLEFNSGLILIDASDIDYRPNVLLEHLTAEDIAKRCAVHPFRVVIAALSPPSQPTANLHLETAARNRGVNLKVFWDREAALEWLMSPDT